MHLDAVLFQSPLLWKTDNICDIISVTLVPAAVSYLKMSIK